MLVRHWQMRNPKGRFREDVEPREKRKEHSQVEASAKRRWIYSTDDPPTPLS